nr:hypothetical protein [Tanacetum cinerariifolium]
DEDEEPFKDEEEEHLAPADSPAVLIINLVPLAEDTEAFKTDESALTPVPSPRREDTSEAELPPRKRLCLTALTSRVNILAEDRQFHYETARLMDQEALVSREAWAQSIGLSSVVHYELQAYRTHTQMQDYRIASQESLMTTLIAHVSSLQGQLSVASGQIQTLQARAEYVLWILYPASTNNMPPKRTSAAVRAAAPMTVAAVEQLIEARVSTALTNHEALRNST